MMWTNEGQYGQTWDPFRDLLQLRSEVNRLFGGITRESAPFPALSLWSDDQQARVRAAIPSADAASLQVHVHGDVLTVEGERKADEPEGAVYHRRERDAGRFRRSVRLPFEVEGDKVEARYEQGLLDITLPRKEATKPRRIAVSQA